MQPMVKAVERIKKRLLIVFTPFFFSLVAIYIIIMPSTTAKAPSKGAPANCQAKAPFTKIPKPMFFITSFILVFYHNLLNLTTLF